MKSVAKFLSGAFRIALRTAVQEAVFGGDVGDVVRQTRGWKLLLLLPLLFLSKAPNVGTIGKDKLVKPFQFFAEGHWELFRFGVQCAADMLMFDSIPDVVTWTVKRSAGRGRSCSPSWESSLLHGKLWKVPRWQLGTKRLLEALRRRLVQFQDPLPDSIVETSIGKPAPCFIGCPDWANIWSTLECRIQ